MFSPLFADLKQCDISNPLKLMLGQAFSYVWKEKKWLSGTNIWKTRNKTFEMFSTTDVSEWGVISFLVILLENTRKVLQVKKCEMLPSTGPKAPKLFSLFVVTLDVKGRHGVPRNKQRTLSSEAAAWHVTSGWEDWRRAAWRNLRGTQSQAIYLAGWTVTNCADGIDSHVFTLVNYSSN